MYIFYIEPIRDFILYFDLYIVDVIAGVAGVIGAILGISILLLITVIVILYKCPKQEGK